MHIASWRVLPILTILAIAAVMFWGLVTVFGSEAGPSSGSALVAGDTSKLPRVPLEFPEVARSLIDPLASPAPSPEPSIEAAAASARTSTKTKVKKPYVPTDGASGDAAVGADGDPTIGPNDRSASAGDATDPVGDLNNAGFENPKEFGPDEPKTPAPPAPAPPAPVVVEDDDDNGTHVDNTNSGNSGNNGANGESEAATDPGDSDAGDD